MKITVTEIPKNITTLFFSSRKIVSDKKTTEYLKKMRPFIFGKETESSAIKLEIDIFDLVFINDKPFSDFSSRYIRSSDSREEKELIKLAVLLRKLYKGTFVRISHIEEYLGNFFIEDPVFVSLNIIDASSDNTALNRKIEKKAEKNSQREKSLGSKAEDILDAVRMAAVKVRVKRELENKELIDKYNYRRFSTSVKLNNRPIEVEEVNRLFAQRKNYTFVDLSDTKTRLTFTALYALTYKGFSIDDLYGTNTVFGPENDEKEERLRRAASELLDIIYNGNGIEISDMIAGMIIYLANMTPPEVDLKNLKGLIENYSVYYAVASFAVICDNAFSLNEDLKAFLKKKIFDKYWLYIKRIILLKQYTSVIALCKKLASLDNEEYRDNPDYRVEIEILFEKVERFTWELETDVR